MERQLVTELLALYTPEAVAGQAELPKARRGAGPAAEQVLLNVLGLTPDEADQALGQSLIRLAALTQLTGLYSSLTPAHQQQLIQVDLLKFLTGSTVATCTAVSSSGRQ